MIISSFYEAIMSRLKTNIPEIKHFDLYFGQYEDEEKDLPFNTPAVFMEYTPLNWESLLNKRLESNVEFNLHVVSEVIQEVDSTTTLSIRNLGHAHLLLIDKINYWMKGFNGNGFNSISNAGMEPYIANGSLIIHILKFKTRLRDDSGKHLTQSVTPSQEILTNIV